MTPVVRWLAAFVVTQLVEVPIYVRAQRGSGHLRVRIAVAFAASTITHPVVWFVMPVVLRGRSYLTMVLCAELFAVLAEAWWLSRFRLRHALAWALAANAASVCVGLALRALTGWP